MVQVCQPHKEAKGGSVMQDDIQSLSHSKWRCQYHIVFAPKFRRKEIYGKLKEDIGKILRTLCEQKGVEIIEAEACPGHIHMLVSIPPSISVAGFMGYLKGKSSLMIRSYSNGGKRPIRKKKRHRRNWHMIICIPFHQH